MAAHNWRALRLRFTENGIPDTMALPSMHIVLDGVEQLGCEASSHGAKTAEEARQKISSYFDRIYRPDLTATIVDGQERIEPPPGFSDEEVEASFDAFLAAGGQ